MIRYAARRLAVTAPILLLISLATFWAAGKISSPAAQIAVNPRISAEARRAYAESLGLNDSFGVRYLRWLGNLATGDFGTSLVRNGQDVWPFVERAMANTLLLVSAAVVLSLGAGLAIGTLSAVRRGSLIDHGATAVSFLGISIPVFWLGLMLGLLFLDALNSGDYPILLATVMIVATAVFVMNLAADLLYAVLDPRIRHG